MQRAMSDVNELFKHEYEHHEDEDEESAHNDAAAASLKPMNSIWDCEYLCIMMQEDNFGKNIGGWTCAYCPHPGDVGGYVIRKSINATKALAHVLKIKGQDVPICKGVIPYPKKKVHKALYNANQIKIKETKMRDATMQGEILEFQDKLLAAYFPAVSATSQRKQPNEDSNTCGGSLLGVAH
jgi:hypothetical protein